MDPLSITASVISVLQLAANISGALYRVIEGDAVNRLKQFADSVRKDARNVGTVEAFSIRGLSAIDEVTKTPYETEIRENLILRQPVGIPTFHFRTLTPRCEIG